MDYTCIYLDDVIREWYGLQALYELVTPYTVPFNKRHDRLKEDILTSINEVTDYLYTMLWDYIPMALCGEMSHAGTKSQRYPVGTRELCSESLYRIAPIATQYSRDSIFETAKIAFAEDMGWTTYFGGKAWQYIADMSKRYRDKLPKPVWVDFIIDLQHNTGTVLSKSNDMFTIGDPNYFGNYLNFKRYASLEEVVISAPNEWRFTNFVKRALQIINPHVDKYIISEAAKTDDSVDLESKFGRVQMYLFVKGWGIGTNPQPKCDNGVPITNGPPISYYNHQIQGINNTTVDLWDFISKYTPVKYGTKKFDTKIVDTNSQNEDISKDRNKRVRHTCEVLHNCDGADMKIIVKTSVATGIAIIKNSIVEMYLNGEKVDSCCLCDFEGRGHIIFELEWITGCANCTKLTSDTDDDMFDIENYM